MIDEIDERTPTAYSIVKKGSPEGEEKSGNIPGIIGRPETTENSLQSTRVLGGPALSQSGGCDPGKDENDQERTNEPGGSSTQQQYGIHEVDPVEAAKIHEAVSKDARRLRRRRVTTARRCRR